MRVRLILFAIVSSIILISGHSQAEIFSEKHVYIMGDNDTKNEARKLCFMEAKRKIIEKAGTYLSSRSEVTNMELNLDEITAFSASVLKSKIISEKWHYKENYIAVELAVEAQVDQKIFEKRIRDLEKSDDLLDRLKNQYNRIQLLEKQIKGIQSKLNNTDMKKASKLRATRIEAITEIDTIEARYGKIIKSVERRRKEIQEKSIDLARKIIRYIEIDMTMEEVESLLGKPESIGSALFDKRLKHYEYHPYRIYFTRDGLVKEIVYLTKCDNCGLSPVIKKYGYDILSDGITEYHKKYPAVVEELKKYVIGSEI